MQFPQAKMKQIRRILTLWPSQVADEGDELLRGYLLAVDDYPADDVEAAVDMLVKGAAPGINPGFRPKPPEVGAECRRIMNLRLDREARDRALRPKLPPPDIERTPESQARVRAMVAQLVENTAEQTRTTEATKRRNAVWQRTNDRFSPSMDEADMKARLGYEVGGWTEDEAA